MADGYRSLLAPWIGGASAPQTGNGYRSLFAFWMGGGAALAFVPPTPGDGVFGGRKLRIRKQDLQWPPFEAFDDEAARKLTRTRDESLWLTPHTGSPM